MKTNLENKINRNLMKLMKKMIIMVYGMGKHGIIIYTEIRKMKKKTKKGCNIICIILNSIK